MRALTQSRHGGRATAAGLAMLAVWFGQAHTAVGARQRRAAPWQGDRGMENLWRRLASTRYAPLDQIDPANFSKLQLAWRLNTVASARGRTGSIRRRPFSSTACSTRQLARHGPWLPSTRDRRGALDAPRGRGARGQNAARGGAGRGVPTGRAPTEPIAHRLRDSRLPDDRARRQDRRAGPDVRREWRGRPEVDNDQDLDLITADLGLNATPLIAGNVVVVGAAHRFSGSPKVDEQRQRLRPWLRRQNRQTSVDLPPVPRPGEDGYETWLEESGGANGNTGAWAQFSADLDSNWSTCQSSCRRATSTAATAPVTRCSAKAFSRWTLRPASANGTIRLPTMASGTTTFLARRSFSTRSERPPRSRRWRCRPNRHFCSCWIAPPGNDLADRGTAGPQSTVPRERTSPTQPFPTRPPPSIARGSARRSDRLHAGPARGRTGPREALQARADLYAAGDEQCQRSARHHSWFRPTLAARTGRAGLRFQTERLYVHSHTGGFSAAVVPADPAVRRRVCRGLARGGGPGARAQRQRSTLRLLPSGARRGAAAAAAVCQYRGCR